MRVIDQNTATALKLSVLKILLLRADEEIR